MYVSVRQNSAQMFEYICEFDINKLAGLLQRLDLEDSLTIVDVYSSDGHSFLHKAAYENTFIIADYFITFYKQRMTKYLKLKLQSSQSDPNEELTDSQHRTIE